MKTSLRLVAYLVKLYNSLICWKTNYKTPMFLWHPEIYIVFVEVCSLTGNTNSTYRPLSGLIIINCFFLMLNLKEQQKSGRSPFTVSLYLFWFLSNKGLKMSSFRSKREREGGGGGGDAPDSGRGMSGAARSTWPGHFLYFYIFVASLGKSRPYSVAGAKPERVSYVQLCVTWKWTVSLTFIRCKFDSRLMVSYFCTGLQGRKCDDVLVDLLE